MNVSGVLTTNLEHYHRKLLQQLKPEQIEVDIVRVEEPKETGFEEAELDEM